MRRAGAVLVAALVVLGLVLRTRSGSGRAEIPEASPSARPESPGSAEREAEMTPGAREAAGLESEAIPAPPVAPEPGPQACQLTVHLVDERGQPLPGGRLAWRGDDPLSTEERAVAYAGPDGRITLVVASDPGLPVVLLGSAPDHAARLEVLRPGTLAGRPEHDLGEWSLVGGGAIEGRVVDENGHPRMGAIVGLTRRIEDPTPRQAGWLRVWPMWSPPRGSVLFVETGADGRYLLQGAPRGHFAVAAALDPRRLERPAPRPDREDVVVEIGATVTVRDLVLASALPEEVLRGRVLDPDGAAVGGASLGLGTESVSFPGGGPSAMDGTFELLVPPDEPLVLTVRDPEGRWQPVRIAGVRGGGSAIEVRFATPMPERPAPAAERPGASEEGSLRPERTPVVVRGKLTLGGRAPGAWTVGWGTGAELPLDPQGAFVLRGALERASGLVFRSGVGSGLARSLWFPLSSRAGEQEWSRDLAVGSLVLSGLPAPDPGGGDLPFDLALESRAEAFQGFVLLARPASGSLTVEDVPAGAVVLRARGAAGSEDFARWPVLTELQVVAGETRRVALD